MVFRAASATEVNRDEAQQAKVAPKPIVKIDNQHDPFATVVSIQYGNKLGELLDTVGFQACVSALWSVVKGHLSLQCCTSLRVSPSVPLQLKFAAQKHICYISAYAMH